MKTIDFLHEVDFFKALTARDLDEIASHTEKIEIPAGQNVISAQDSGKYFYFISSGTIRLKFSQRSGDEALALILQKPDVFGEVALLSGNVKTEAAIAREDAVIYRLSREYLSGYMVQFPVLRKSMTKLLSKKFSFEPALIIPKGAAQYENIQEIGRNKKESIAYKAKLINQNKFVAIKMVPFDLMFDHSFAERFESETGQITKLSHRNIVKTLKIEKAYSTYFIHMEFISGENLQSLLARRTLTLAESLKIIRQIADALSYAHSKKILHRNLKPDNIMVDSAGHVKIVDFGLGRSDTIEFENGEVLLKGTPAYMAPEQIKDEDIGPEADVYAFGVICYQMLSGHLPFSGQDEYQTAVMRLEREAQPVGALNPEIPEELSDLVMSFLEKDPEKRETDINAVAQFAGPGTETTPEEYTSSSRSFGAYNMSGGGGGFFKVVSVKKILTVLAIIVIIAVVVSLKSKSIPSKDIAPLAATHSSQVSTRNLDRMQATQQALPEEPLYPAVQEQAQPEPVTKAPSAPEPEPEQQPEQQPAQSAPQTTPEPTPQMQQPEAQPQPKQDIKTQDEAHNENLLLKGQVYFLQKDYKNAIAQWNRVPPESSFYEEAGQNIMLARSALKRKN